MKNYANIQVLDNTKEKVIVRYKGLPVRRSALEERSIFVTLNTGMKNAEYKYYVGAIRHYKTWWGTKCYINKILDKPFTPSTFYK